MMKTFPKIPANLSKNRPRRTLLAAFVSLALLAVLPASASPAAGQTGGRDVLEEKLFQDANRERTSRGLSVFIYDDRLETVARLHCSNMIRAGFVGHVDPQGRDAGERVSAGYPALLGGFGENLAVFPAAQPAGLDDAIMSAWVDSLDHSVNLFSMDYEYTGVGVQFFGNSVYAVQIFGTILAEYRSSSPARPRAGGTAELTFRRTTSTPRYRLSVYVKFPDASAVWRSPDGKTCTGGGYFEPSWFGDDFTVTVPLVYGRGTYTVYAVKDGVLYPNGYGFEAR